MNLQRQWKLSYDQTNPFTFMQLPVFVHFPSQKHFYEYSNTT